MYFNDQILHLILKKLKGEATEEEMQQLRSWTQANNLNAEAYEEILKIWTESEPLLQGAAFDTERAWSLLQQRMEVLAKESAVRKLSPVRYIKRFAIAAAVLVILLTAGYMWRSPRAAVKTITAQNNMELVYLPDSSQVWLREGSTLSYAPFSGNERTTSLKGEAFFDIRRNESRPFIINTLHAQVKVLGTSFLVNAGERADEVVVTRGKVMVADRENKNNGLLLEAGQQLTLANHQLQRSMLTDSNSIAWKTGLLSFREAPLPKVMNDLSNYYNTQVGIMEAERKEAEDLHITLRFEGQSLDEVLEEIRLITGWKTRKEKDKIILYKNDAVFE